MLRSDLHLLSSSSSSSEDTDGEIIQYITRRRRKTNMRIDQFLVEDTEFLCRYRVTMATARFLVQCIQPRMQSRSSKNNALTISEKLLLALRFYATCSIQQLVGDVNNIHQATVSRAIHQVSEALASLASQYIHMPRTETEIANVSYDFYTIGQFPRVIGAIDCTHVPIQSPEHAHSDDIPLQSLEESLFSSEKLDRASPELWPEQIPGVSEFTPLPSNEQPPWNKGLTKEDIMYMQQLGSLSTSGVIMEVKKLHDLAYQLGLEEAKEMTRGKYLNIFSSRRNR